MYIHISDKTNKTSKVSHYMCNYVEVHSYVQLNLSVHISGTQLSAAQSKCSHIRYTIMYSSI